MAQPNEKLCIHLTYRREGVVLTEHDFPDSLIIEEDSLQGRSVDEYLHSSLASSGIDLGDIEVSWSPFDPDKKPFIH